MDGKNEIFLSVNLGYYQIHMQTVDINIVQAILQIGWVGLTLYIKCNK